VPAAVAGATLVRRPPGDAEPASPGAPLVGLLVALALAWPTGSPAQDLRRDDPGNVVRERPPDRVLQHRQAGSRAAL